MHAGFFNYFRMHADAYFSPGGLKFKAA